MGKKSKAKHIEDLKNDSSIMDEEYINDRVASKLMDSKKKSWKTVDSRAKRESKLVNQQNRTRASSLHNLREIPKNKRKKMGKPIIVKDTEGAFPTVPLPLRHKITEHPIANAISLGAFFFCDKKNLAKTKNRIRVTTAECLKPSQEAKKSDEKINTCNDAEESARMENPVILSNNKDVSRPMTFKESSHIENLASSNNPQECENSDDLLVKRPELSLELEYREDIKPVPRFYSFRNKVLVIMETDCKFCFHGKLIIRVLYGAVRIYGFIVNTANTKFPLTIYSPRAYSPLAIEAINSDILEKNISKIWQILERECDDRKLANRLELDVSRVEEGWVILILENFDNSLTNFLATNFPQHLFPRINDPSNHSWCDPRRAEIVLQSNLYFGNLYPKTVIESRDINDVADSITYTWETKKYLRAIVTGGKGVGKSTMSRYIVNKLLAISESVVFIDLDPGQAEFTPAGCISLTIIDKPLLGPNFTHLQRPYYQLYIGSSDINRCLTHYVDGIKKLVDRLNNDSRLGNRPLVVNTMGYCKGIGWDIMCYVIKILSTTDVIQIRSRRPKNNFDKFFTHETIDRQNFKWISWKKDESILDKPMTHRLRLIYSKSETGTGTAESWNLEAHQQRDLAMISYLSKIIKVNDHTISQVRGISSCINATPPYAIPFSSISVSLAGAFILQVLSVMNGNIVALCGVDLESTEKSDCAESITASYPRVLLRPPLSTCYGYGILRGVDMEKEHLFINTPLSPSHMRHVNCLIGCTNLPQSLLQLNQQEAPYTGREYDLPTSRGPRRGYFRMRYRVDT